MLSQQRDIFGKVESAEPDLTKVVLFLKNELTLVEERRIDCFCHFCSRILIIKLRKE